MWDKKNSEQVVVLLQRAQLSLFRSSTGKVVSLPFEVTEVQDLEVINEDNFCKHLATFIQQQKLTKASVILLLDSSIYFSQKVETEVEQGKKTPKPEERQDQVSDKVSKPSLIAELENKRKLFAQSVPFANVFSTTVSIGKEKFFLALNRDFYEPVIKVFSNKDIRVISILPIAVVSPLFASDGFTSSSATALINSVDKYKPHNFLEGSLKAEAPIVSTALPSDPSDKKILVLMIVLFVVLIGVLVAVILWSRQRDQQLTQISTPPLPPVAQPVATPVATPALATSAATLTELLSSTESALVDMEALSVSVIDASADSSARTLLVERLEEVGFESVPVRTAANITGPMIVTFNSTVPVELQQVLDIQLKEWGYQARFEEDEEQTDSITFTLTNQ